MEILPYATLHTACDGKRLIDIQDIERFFHHLVQIGSEPYNSAHGSWILVFCMILIFKILQVFDLMQYKVIS